MSGDAIEKILADFRTWLSAPGRDTAPAERVDFPAIVGHFTALRHEVNLQTKATRTLGEQTAKLLETMDAAPSKPVVKAFLDLADVLAVSHKQMLKLRETVEPLLERLAAEPLPPEPTVLPGRLARLFGATTSAWLQWAGHVKELHAARAEACAAAAETLLDLAQAAADGYAISLRRVERALPELGLEPIECVGQPFDPETMEVVSVSGEGAAGIVAEELRRGYRANGTLIRCAQVRVAR